MNKYYNVFSGLTLTEMRAEERMNIAIEAFNKTKNINRKKNHGDSMRHSKHHYLYDTWSRLKKRCYHKSHQNFHNYGGRGIKMYQLWKNDYLTFKNWVLNNLGERSVGEFIWLIDSNGNYIPGNIKWETRKFK